MDNPFQSPKRRLNRARDHIKDLLASSDRFFDANPARMNSEMNADGTREELFFTFGAPFPPELGEIAADIIENLRSALDQTGYAAAVLGGKIEPKNAYFPICQGGSEELDRVVKDRCKDAPEEIRTIFREFKAYYGGNLSLWAFNRLCSINKHRLLTATGASGALHIQRGDLQNGRMSDKLVWDREKSRMPFAVLYPGGYLAQQSKFTFGIAFAEVEPIAGVAALAFLDAAVREVERVITATEAECRRIGLLT